jgi:hypothetical protein
MENHTAHHSQMFLVPNLSNLDPKYNKLLKGALHEKQKYKVAQHLPFLQYYNRN